MSTTDREQLALAAKAAGLGRAAWDFDWLQANGLDVARDMLWDPRWDSGQALELAVLLDLDVFQAPGYREAQVGGAVATTIFESWGSDKLAATRLAIFRAAVEIGKAMP